MGAVMSVFSLSSFISDNIVVVIVAVVLSIGFIKWVFAPNSDD
jgi:hypothetical protein